MPYKTDMIIQYSVVGAVLLAACGWILWKLLRKKPNKNSGSCCGCALADNCDKKQNGKSKDLQR